MDELDFKILKIIDNNCRISYSKIAEKLNLSHRKVSQRIESMIELEIIKRFSIHLNYELLGLHQYIGLLIFPEEINVAQYYKNLQLIPEIIKIWHLLDDTIIISFLIKNSLQLEQLVNSILKTGAILDDYKEITSHKPLISLFSSTDWRILLFLLNNSRLSNKEIANNIGISAKTVKRRINRMINKNLIHFTLEINFEAITGMVPALVSINANNSSEDVYTSIKNENTIKYWRKTGIYPPLIELFIYGKNLKEIYEMFNEMKNRTYINSVQLSFIVRNWENNAFLENAIEEKLQLSVGFDYNKNLIN
jgi:DNA-binding Lrp family transcriptional regulator